MDPLDKEDTRKRSRRCDVVAVRESFGRPAERVELPRREQRHDQREVLTQPSVVAYLAFQSGAHTLAAEMTSWDPDEASRLRAAAARYEALLRR